MRTVGLLLGLNIVAGCTASYTQTPVSGAGSKILAGKAVAISTPGNGTYEGNEYSHSGQMTALAVKAAFAKFAGDVHVIPNCSSMSCLRGAAPAGVEYFAIPEILHWEDRATEWSGIKDKLEVRLTIYGLQGDAPIAATVLSGKSKWMTFGGDHPQDLLVQPVEAYVASLY